MHTLGQNTEAGQDDLLEDEDDSKVSPANPAVFAQRFLDPAEQDKLVRKEFVYAVRQLLAKNDVKKAITVAANEANALPGTFDMFRQCSRGFKDEIVAITEAL